MKESFKSPKVRVADVALVSYPAEDPRGPWSFNVTLEVENPNAYPLNVAHVAYSAVMGKETVADGDHHENIRVEASGPTFVKVPLTLRPEAFMKAARQSLHAKQIAYELNGSLGLQAPILGLVRIPFSKTGNIDALDLLRKKALGFN